MRTGITLTVFAHLYHAMALDHERVVCLDATILVSSLALVCLVEGAPLLNHRLGCADNTVASFPLAKHIWLVEQKRAFSEELSEGWVLKPLAGVAMFCFNDSVFGLEKTQAVVQIEILPVSGLKALVVWRVLTLLGS